LQPAEEGLPRAGWQYAHQAHGGWWQLGLPARAGWQCGQLIWVVSGQYGPYSWLPKINDFVDILSSSFLMKIAPKGFP
jgi:hypothetical protein